MRTLRLPLIAALMAAVAFAMSATGGLLGPRTLEAAACAAFPTGRICSADCTRECPGGGCCGWTYTYWNGGIEIE